MKFPFASNEIESSNKHALAVTSPDEFDHQPMSPWFGPTPKAPALGDNFQVPTNGETGGGGGHNG